MHTLPEQRSSSRRSSRGFTLIEILVTITLISVGIMLLGTMLMQASKTAAAAAAVSYQTAELASSMSQLDALPFDQLAAGTTCDTVAVSQLPRIRCATIATISTKVKRVTVTVTPTGSHAPPAQSVTFDRTISGFGNPLNTP